MDYGFFFDYKKCCGCYACTVACMDQNDIRVEAGDDSTNAFRRIYKNEEGAYPDTRVQNISIACMHCEDAPCVMGCPTGAIHKDDKNGATLVDEDLCIGCHSCAIACPFGVPRYIDGKMQKCEMCLLRVEHGYSNPCVKACPTEALRFGNINEFSDEKEGVVVRKLFSK